MYRLFYQIQIHRLLIGCIVCICSLLLILFSNSEKIVGVAEGAGAATLLYLIGFGFSRIRSAK
ncbi:MAG: hypothetical protein J7539_08820 [Niabella sp.]|nr:hypothetical protein [Niabella sp.]